MGVDSSRRAECPGAVAAQRHIHTCGTVRDNIERNGARLPIEVIREDNSVGPRAERERSRSEGRTGHLPLLYQEDRLSE